MAIVRFTGSPSTAMAEQNQTDGPYVTRVPSRDGQPQGGPSL
jgi:hypothetical protein